jgi:phospholipase C
MDPRPPSPSVGTSTAQRWIVIAVVAGLFPVVLLSSLEVPTGTLCPGPSAHPPVAHSPIQHLFFLIKENHALENYFGALPGVRGYPPNGSFPIGIDSNQTISPSPLAGSSTPDLPHDQASELVDLNGGLNNLFVAEAAARGAAAPEDAVGYYTATQIPDYYTYAHDYLLDDEFFTGVLGPTIPNRFYDVGLTGLTWSLDLPPPPSAVSGPNILSQFQQADLPWDYLYSGGGEFATPFNLPQIAGNACALANILPMDDLGSVLHGPNPPALSFIDPSADPLYSEHPPANVTLGEEWTVAVLNEIFGSPIGTSSAVFLFWDEAGGFWDPATPPVVPPQGDGFRVPLLVFSPWTPTGVIDHQVMDPATLLQFADDNWGLPPVSPRVGIAPSLSSVFDFGAAARPPILLSTPVDLGPSPTARTFHSSATPPPASLGAAWEPVLARSSTVPGDGLCDGRPPVRYGRPARGSVAASAARRRSSPTEACPLRRTAGRVSRGTHGCPPRARDARRLPRPRFAPT